MFETKGTYTRNNFEDEYILSASWFEPMHFPMFFDNDGEDVRERLEKASPKFKTAMKKLFLDSRDVAPDQIINRTYVDVYTPRQIDTEETRIYNP